MSRGYNYESSKEQNRVEFEQMYKSLTDPDTKTRQSTAAMRDQREKDKHDDACLS